MDIPKVNAGATDRNRAQTKRICKLTGWGYSPNYSPRPHAWRFQGWNKMLAPRKIDLPNGSLTLCQVVEMLSDLKVGYWGGDRDYSGRWEREEAKFEDTSEEVILESGDPHDLTDAMDALIKLLEKKS